MHGSMNVKLCKTRMIFLPVILWIWGISLNETGLRREEKGAWGRQNKKESQNFRILF